MNELPPGRIASAKSRGQSPAEGSSGPATFRRPGEGRGFPERKPLDSLTEFKLLEVMAENRGRIVSRDTLLARVWGYSAADTRTVDMHVFRLRRKIEEDPENPKILLTVRGRGFRLCGEDDRRENP